MRRLPFIVLFLSVAVCSFGYHRRPNHKPPPLPELSDQQKLELQSKQMVVPEVGTVPMNTQEGLQFPVPVGDPDAEVNVASAILPPTTHTGNGILKQVQEEIAHREETVAAKLPGFACVLAFLLIGGYALSKYVDMAIPYKGRRKRQVTG